MQNIVITTECVADLPQELINQYNIGIIYYMVKTDSGLFRDTDEITAQNVMEYMMGGEKKALSIYPSVSEYEEFFRENLKQYDEIIHISISSKVSGAFENAKTAAAKFQEAGKRIQVIDSGHLSSGQGLLVLTAARLAREGQNSWEIIEEVEGLVPRVSTSFLAYNADYLYYNGKVSEGISKLCRIFLLHPVLSMVDGKLTVRKIYMGRFEHAARHYVKSVGRLASKVDKKIGFVTYAGCNLTSLEAVSEDVQKRIGFEAIYEQQASASISCNCGPNTFGVLFIKK